MDTSTDFGDDSHAGLLKDGTKYPDGNKKQMRRYISLWIEMKMGAA